MKVNLKTFAQQKEQLKYVEKILLNQQTTKALSKKIGKIIRFYDEVETDLEMIGESIIEIDMPRLEAIEERNKMLEFLNNGDDL
jgi:hypothetical protein